MNDEVRILIAINSKISLTGGGLERTTLNLQNFINNQEGYKAYGLYNDFEFDSELYIKGVIEDPLDLRKIVIEKKIDIILFPAGPWYTDIGRDAVVGLECKIITAYHSKEGYESFIFYMNLISKLRNSSGLSDNFKWLVKLVLAPLTKLLEKLKFKKLMQSSYEKSDAFVLLSDKFIKGFRKYYDLKDDEKICAIGNFLSFTNVNFDSSKLINKKNRILIVSRLQESQKSISTALYAWKELQETFSDWHLDIVGDGIDKQYYIKLIGDLKLKRVNLHGKQIPNKFYEDASIFLMTSKIEGWGMTLTEAQQYGCVPIAVDTYESLHDILDNNNSIIIPNDKYVVDNLKKSTALLMEDKSLRYNLAVNGLKDCQRFSREIIGEKWIQLFNKIIND